MQAGSVQEGYGNPSVSIIVPVYNVADYLEDCVQSLLSQTVENVEVILVDDGSSDNSPAICDRFAEKDSRVRVLHQENAGVSIARNNGMALARGEWIMFVDGDDWLPGDAVQILLSAIGEDTDCDIVAGSLYWSLPDQQAFSGAGLDWGIRVALDLNSCRRQLVEYVVENVYFPQLSEMECFLCSPCVKMYNKAFLDRHEIRFVPHQKKSEDQVFNLYAVQHARKLVAVNLPVYYYRIWEGSYCQRFKTNQIPMEDLLFWKREVETFLRTYGYSDDLIAFFNFRKARLMTTTWLESHLMGEITWPEVKANIHRLEEIGLSCALYNPYYSWQNYVFAIAIRYKMCRLLLFIWKQMSREWH